MRNLLGITLAFGTLIANAGDIVLFDATKTPLSAVAAQSGGTFALTDGLLAIETKGNLGYPVCVSPANGICRAATASPSSWSTATGRGVAAHGAL